LGQVGHESSIRIEIDFGRNEAKDCHCHQENNFVLTIPVKHLYIWQLLFIPFLPRQFVKCISKNAITAISENFGRDSAIPLPEAGSWWHSAK
jgi:hypothetical protein